MDLALIILKIFCFLSSFFGTYREYCDYKQAINLSNYNYPDPSKKTDELYRIAILGTNDIHGAAFPFIFRNPYDNTTYEYGGLQNLASYVRILQKEWKERFLWLDGGDQFQGKIESKISNGSIITDFFNTVLLNGSSIGNHEWDYGQLFLTDRLQSASWPYLAANIFNNQNQTGFLPDTSISKIYTMGLVNIGVIGLSTIQTPYTTSGNLTNINFAKYRDIVVTQSKALRDAGANAVFLVSHVGMSCNNETVDKMIMTMRNSSTTQGECSDDEMKILLNSLDSGTVDAVVAGHVHNVAHHWVNGVPVVQSIDGGYYSNVIYLAFNSTTKKIVTEQSQIEGPIPTCSQVFEISKKCSYLTNSTAQTAGKKRKFIFHNKIVKPDNSLTVLFDKWWQEVKVYKVRLTTTDFYCIRGRTKENAFGNLIADIYKNITGSDISILNDGSLRSQWAIGDVLVEDVYNMFPFDNLIVTYEMTGSEFKKALGQVQSGAKGFYHTSGLLQNVTASPMALVGVTLYNGSPIDDNTTYTIATNDFCANGGDDFKLVASWYTPRNLKTYGLLRDIVISSLRNKTGIYLNDLLDPYKKRLNIIG